MGAAERLGFRSDFAASFSSLRDEKTLLALSLAAMSLNRYGAPQAV